MRLEGTESAASAPKRREREWRSRHNLALTSLARDPDERFRPSKKLAALARACAAPSHRSLDRPLVPVLNQLIAKGLTTQFSCADGQIVIRGASAEAARLVEPLLTRLPGAHLEWRVLGERMVTELRWRSPDAAVNDRALLAASKAIDLLPANKESAAVMEVGGEELHPGGTLLAHAFARIEALMDYKQEPTVILSQTPNGYWLHVGYSLKGVPETKLAAGNLEDLETKFDAEFPPRQEELEVG
jgi:hypothetical protein